MVNLDLFRDASTKAQEIVGLYMKLVEEVRDHLETTLPSWTVSGATHYHDYLLNGALEEVEFPDSDMVRLIGYPTAVQANRVYGTGKVLKTKDLVTFTLERTIDENNPPLTYQITLVRGFAEEQPRVGDTPIEGSLALDVPHLIGFPMGSMGVLDKRKFANQGYLMNLDDTSILYQLLEEKVKAVECGEAVFDYTGYSPELQSLNGFRRHILDKEGRKKVEKAGFVLSEPELEYITALEQKKTEVVKQKELDSLELYLESAINWIEQENNISMSEGSLSLAITTAEGLGIDISDRITEIQERQRLAQIQLLQKDSDETPK